MSEAEYIKMAIIRRSSEYIRANKKRKSEILEQLAIDTGRSKKSLARSLRNKGSTKPRKSPGRPIKYTLTTRKILQKVWDANDYICAERFFEDIPDTLKDMQEKELLRHIPPEEVEKVRNISLGSLKLQLTKIPKVRRGTTSSNSGVKNLQKRIAIRTYFEKEIDPGFFGIDFVDHNGGNAFGPFARTLQFVDPMTTLAVKQACLGKDRIATESAFENIKLKIPYEIKGLHSDNEGSLLQTTLGAKAHNEKIFITRTRSYHKEDNGHVEQKNGDKIRLLVGYRRYDTKEQVDILNEIYEVDDLYQNHFIRSQKLCRKEYNLLGKVVKKVYEKPKTAYQRIIENKQVPIKEKMKLMNLHKRLNRITLKERRDKLLMKLLKF